MRNKVLTIALIFAISMSIVSGVSANSDNDIRQYIVDKLFEFLGSDANGISFGGATNYDYVDTDNGYYVDGTQVIDGSGNVDAPVTTTTITASGESSLSRTHFGGATATLSTTSATTLQLTAANVCDNSYFASDPNGASSSMNTPTAAAMIADCIPGVGDYTFVHFENTANGAENYTVVASTTIDLIEPSGGDVVIAQNEDATIQFINVDGSIVKAIVTSLQAGD